MQFETPRQRTRGQVKHIEGHTYVFAIGAGDRVSGGTYRTEPFVGHGAQDFLAAAREIAQEAYAASKKPKQPGICILEG